ncbi:MAG: hypothetical protein KJO98_00490, partial [Rhodothermia bacterium]|nr:hypothetical protein [Rhodothermia bacterium]
VEFRRRVQAERFEIPPKTDAELFSRVGSRSSRPGLTRRNAWEQKRLGSMQSRATIGSLAGVVALLLIVVTMFSSEQISVDDTAGQEVVRFETATPSVAPVYVFYPGLVIEESR